MSRFISWLAVGVAAAFLVVVSTSFSRGSIGWLAFAVSIGTLVVSAGIAYDARASLASASVALLIVVISAWMIVASLVFSQATVQHLTLGASLGIAGLALVGLTDHELSYARAAQSAEDGSSERETRLAAAA
jgi:hypothetical protein